MTDELPYWKQDVSTDGSSNRGLTVLMILLTLSLVVTGTVSVVQSQQIAAQEDRISDLESQLLALQAQYDQLSEDYNDLFSDFENLQEAFEEPLSNPVTPTITQVRNWLTTDDTDTYDYETGVWMCGDFAAMLMTRAKEMNWRMRICVACTSLEGQSGYGSTSMTYVYGSYAGHVFNMIDTTTGIYYIEPQSDARWYITSGSTGDHIEMRIQRYYNFEDFDSGTIWDGYSIWTNFYGYFG